MPFLNLRKIFVISSFLALTGLTVSMMPASFAATTPLSEDDGPASILSDEHKDVLQEIWDDIIEIPLDLTLSPGLVFSEATNAAGLHEVAVVDPVTESAVFVGHFEPSHIYNSGYYQNEVVGDFLAESSVGYASGSLTGLNGSSAYIHGFIQKTKVINLVDDQTIYDNYSILPLDIHTTGLSAQDASISASDYLIAMQELQPATSEILFEFDPVGSGGGTSFVVAAQPSPLFDNDGGAGPKDIEFWRSIDPAADVCASSWDACHAVAQSNYNRDYSDCARNSMLITANGVIACGGIMLVPGGQIIGGACAIGFAVGALFNTYSCAKHANNVYFAAMNQCDADLSACMSALGYRTIWRPKWQALP